MGEDPLDVVIRLVAEGRLSADEAGPILAALEERSGAEGSRRGSAPGAEPRDPDGARSLRIEVREQGRVVVNMRLPLAVGRYAVDRIPGLSADQVARVRAALGAGMTGTVFAVDDSSGSVRIAID